MRRIDLTPCFGFVLAIAATAHADDCIFSQIRWRTEGVEFLAGTASETRTLRVDPASGRLVCLDPQVREPVQVGARIVFTDLFGVFEFEPGNPPKHVLFVPSAGRTFVRGVGADARGRTLVWTYDRERAEHVLWSAGGTGFERIVQPGGPAALGAWQARNVGRPFPAALTRFVRSTCLRRPHGDERLCVESIAGTERWRLTLGPPQEIDQLLSECTPVAFAAMPDSQVALVEVVEPAAGSGQAAALVTWLVRWSQGAQRVTRVSPPPARPRASWFHFDGKTSVSWADASGSLWRIPLDGTPVTALIEVPPETHHADLFRVVVAVTDRRAAADSVRARLASAGQAAGVRQRDGRYEVQAGVYAERGPAQARVAALRQKGFNGVRVEPGDATAIAPGLDFGQATAAGRTAWVRHVERSAGVYSELWIQGPGEAPRLLVPCLDGGIAASP